MWRHFGDSGVWLVIWSWATTTAKRLLADALRRAQADALEHRATMDAIPAATREYAAIPIDALVERLQSAIGETERQTLHLIVGGVTDNDRIARIRGLTVRAVQKARQRLGCAAISAWKECRAVRPGTSLVV